MTRPSPISADVQSAYRSVLGSQTSPTTFDLDTPLTPVVVVAQASVNSGATFVKPTDGTNNASFTTSGQSKCYNNLPSPDGTQTIVTKSSGKNGTAITAGTGSTLYTVTGGKTFYMTSANFDFGTAGSMEVRDNGSGGTVKLAGQEFTGSFTHEMYVFPTPIAFTTNVWLDTTANTTVTWSFNGYEQ